MSILTAGCAGCWGLFGLILYIGQNDTVAFLIAQATSVLLPPVWPHLPIPVDYGLDGSAATAIVDCIKDGDLWMVEVPLKRRFVLVLSDWSLLQVLAFVLAAASYAYRYFRSL